jgi:hypothetical protein
MRGTRGVRLPSGVALRDSRGFHHVCASIRALSSDRYSHAVSRWADRSEMELVVDLMMAELQASDDWTAGLDILSLDQLREVVEVLIVEAAFAGGGVLLDGECVATYRSEPFRPRDFDAWGRLLRARGFRVVSGVWGPDIPLEFQSRSYRIWTWQEANRRRSRVPYARIDGAPVRDGGQLLRDLIQRLKEKDRAIVLSMEPKCELRPVLEDCGLRIAGVPFIEPGDGHRLDQWIWQPE